VEPNKRKYIGSVEWLACGQSSEWPMYNISVAKKSVSFEFEDADKLLLLVLKDNGEGQYVGSAAGYNYVGIRSDSDGVVRIQGLYRGLYEGEFKVFICEKS